MSMNEFIIEFDNLNYRMDNHNMKLPKKVLAFKLSHGASVSENQRQTYLKLANDLNHGSMKDKINNILEDKINNISKHQEDHEMVTINQEESAMISEQKSNFKSCK